MTIYNLINVIEKANTLTSNQNKKYNSCLDFAAIEKNHSIYLLESEIYAFYLDYITQP